jgi:hypothetical protein
MLLVEANRGVNGERHECVGRRASRAAWDALESAIGAFKERVCHADQLCDETGAVPDDVAFEVRSRFDCVVREMHTQIGSPALTARERQDLGLGVRGLLLPLLRCGDPVRDKPRRSGRERIARTA